jgi:hypothetical protein
LNLRFDEPEIIEIIGGSCFIIVGLVMVIFHKTMATSSIHLYSILGIPHVSEKWYRRGYVLGGIVATLFGVFLMLGMID